jgi:transposase
MKGRPTKRISLEATQREELEQLARQKRKSRSVAFRARIVLHSAEGRFDVEVAKTLRTSNSTVGFWRKRFLEGGVDGLFDEPRVGAPRQIDDEEIEKVVTATLEKSPTGATHWSTRLLAKKLNLSQSSISRIWRAFGLKPHRSETFVLSKDPQLVQKVRDIVGLYLSPPVNALVLCVDEKSQIQALSRSQPILPFKPGQLERHTPDYFRHGTTSLFAALDIATGKVIGRCFDKHRSQEFRKFLDLIDESIPAEFEVHLVLDNYATHKTELIKRWLLKRPRYHLHFTPTHASWLNQVER